jgi:hypothetical protein
MPLHNPSVCFDMIYLSQADTTCEPARFRGTAAFSMRAIAAWLLLAVPTWAQEAPNAGYNRDTPIETLAADPAAAAVLNKDLPGLLTDSQYPMFKRMSLKAIQQASGGDLSAEDISKTVADLQALAPH